LRTIHVGNGGASGSQCGRSKEASQETEGKEHAKVDRVDKGQLEAAENEECTDVHPQATDLRDLTEGRPDNGTKTVTSNVEGKTEGSGDLGDAEASHHIQETGCVDGGTDVYGEGEETDLKGDEESLPATPVAWILSHVSAMVIIKSQKPIPEGHLAHTSR
jgi:hypothetical protein